MGLQASNVALIMLMAVAFLGLCAWISRLLAINKGYDGGQGLRAGLFLGVFGIVVYLLMPQRTAPGEPVDYDVAILQGVCPSCGVQTKIFEGFCTECGAQVGEQFVADSPAPPLPPAAASPTATPAAAAAVAGSAVDPSAETAESAPVSEGICTSCGAPTRFFEGFCTKCGAQAGIPAGGQPEDVRPAPAEAESRAGPAPRQSEPEVAEKLCPGCGRISEFRGGRCTTCGTELEL